MASTLRLLPVEGSATRRAFIELPKRLYRDDPHWVTPLNRDLQALLQHGKHPFHSEGRIDALLALRGDAVVGRIAAIHNPAHQRHCGEDAAFFGFFECEQDREVAQFLLQAVTERSQGHALLRGPYSPTTNYECGVLVAGEPGRPMLMMPHNPAWYGALLENCGLRKAMDLIAFRYRLPEVNLERWERIAALVQRRENVTLRPFEPQHFERELKLVQQLYHDAWSANWGFVPMSAAELHHMAAELRPILRADLGAFVLREGREVGFHLGLPDYNEVLQRLNGKLWPFGIVRILLSKRRLRHMRLMLMGISREFQQRGLDVLLYADVTRRARAAGMKTCEASWVLETNTTMRNTLLRSGSEEYRTYRLYEKPL